MTDTSSSPKLMFPALAGLYRHTVPLSWLIIRLAAGVILFVHGWQKIGHIDGVVGSMVKNGISPPLLVAYVVTCTETMGAACVALGLFTRFAAAACAIDLGVITFHVLMPKGFTWTQGGYEFLLMWGLIMFAIALRGGGPYSLDHALGREL